MRPISSIALSGMNAAQAALAASAHNIANLNTIGFHRQEAVLTEQASGGVASMITTTHAKGSALTTDIVAQLQAKQSFLANLAVFKTANSLAGTLIDKVT